MGLEEGGGEERFIDVCAGEDHAMALTWVSFVDLWSIDCLLFGGALEI
jgi:hypothetical protein